MSQSDLLARVGAHHNSIVSALAHERETTAQNRHGLEAAIDQLHEAIERMGLHELGKYDALLARLDHHLANLGQPLNGAAPEPQARPSLMAKPALKASQ